MIIELGNTLLRIEGLENNIFTSGYFIHNNIFYKGTELKNFVRQLCLEYKLEGEVPRFSGCFQIVLLDNESQQLTVIQDRWGTYPLFYNLKNNKITISDDYRKLVSKESNYERSALIELLAFGHVIGDKTLLSNIKEFKPHSITKLSFKEEIQLEEVSYWSYQLDPQKVDFERASLDFAELWHSKMKLMSNAIDGEKAYVPLSAGLDSRLIAAALDLNGIEQTNLTFGAGSDNIEIDTAKTLSKLLKGSKEHQILNIDQEGYRKVINESYHGYRITTAYFSEKDLWYPTQNRNQLSSFMPGHSGDFMAGSHLKTKMKLWKSNEDVAKYLIEFKSSPLGRHLFSTDKQFHDSLWDSVLNSLGEGDPINVFIRWDLEERQRRYIIRSVVAEKYKDLPLLILPYFDYDLMDMFARLPFSYLHNTVLYRKAIGNHILKDQSKIRKLKVNGKALNPILKGAVLEYYQKIKAVLNLDQKNNAVFDQKIDWNEFIGSAVYPDEVNSKWIDPNYYKSNARFFYSLKEFHKEFALYKKDV